MLCLPSGRLEALANQRLPPGHVHVAGPADSSTTRETRNPPICLSPIDFRKALLATVNLHASKPSSFLLLPPRDRNELPCTKLDSTKKCTSQQDEKPDETPRSQKTFHKSRTTILAVSSRPPRLSSHFPQKTPVSSPPCSSRWSTAKQTLRAFGAHRPASDASTQRRHLPKTRAPTDLPQNTTRHRETSKTHAVSTTCLKRNTRKNRYPNRRIPEYSTP